MTAEIQHATERSFMGMTTLYRAACRDCGWHSPSTGIQETAHRETVEHNDKEHKTK